MNTGMMDVRWVVKEGWAPYRVLNTVMAPTSQIAWERAARKYGRGVTVQNHQVREPHEYLEPWDNYPEIPC